MLRWLLIVCMTVSPAFCRADEFDVIDSRGVKATLSGRIHGTADNVLAIMQEDGALMLVPSAAILKRRQKEEFQPVSCTEMKSRLEKKYTPELSRWSVQDPYVVGLVLMGPLDKKGETQANLFLTKAVRFMQSVDEVFMRFAKDMGIAAQNSEFPLVMLIFESDAEFEAHANEVTGGRGLSAGNVSGFYSLIDNTLSIRMTECDTFEVPLHEAIHQQVYNRGVMKRFTPIPAWFNEGLATGFEGSGDKVSTGPNALHTRYALAAARTQQVSWRNLIESDEAITGDILAGEAYALAWGLHWLVVTRHKDGYVKYLAKLRTRDPLSTVTPEQRVADFQEAFGVPVQSLEQEFVKLLRANERKIMQQGENRFPVGILMTSQSLGYVKLQAATRADMGGLVHAKGELRNVSPLREMNFRVRVVTDAGTYAEWILPNVGSRKTVPLPGKLTDQLLPNARGGAGRTFTVKIDSTAAEVPAAGIRR